jgi:hypothetical protein
MIQELVAAVGINQAFLLYGYRLDFINATTIQIQK